MRAKFIQYLCYSNVWIALGAASFSLLFFFLKSIPTDWKFISFIFCSTLLTYTYQRYQKLIDNERVKGERMDWMKENLKLVKFILLIALIGTVFFTFFLSFKSIGILAFLGLISFLYAYKLKSPVGKRTNLRDIPSLKIILIGFVWAGSSVLLIDNEFDQIDLNSVLSFIGATLFIIGITIPFDIRDLYVDEASKKTIPQLIGYPPSILVAVIVILLSAYFIHLGTGFNFWILFGASGAVSFIILPSKPQKQELFYSFSIDGILLLYPGLIYLLNSL